MTVGKVNRSPSPISLWRVPLNPSIIGVNICYCVSRSCNALVSSLEDNAVYPAISVNIIAASFRVIFGEPVISEIYSRYKITYKTY